MDNLLILPMDLINIIFKEIDSFSLILSLTCKQFHYWFKDKKIVINLDELLIRMTVPLIKFMINFKIIYDHKNILCQEISKCGNLEVLKWARENGCSWNVSTCENAASGGHLEVLKWAHENACPWDKWTCEKAAQGGHLEVLKWARENGCAW